MVRRQIPPSELRSIDVALICSLKIDLKRTRFESMVQMFKAIMSKIPEIHNNIDNKIKDYIIATLKEYDDGNNVRFLEYLIELTSVETLKHSLKSMNLLNPNYILGYAINKVLYDNRNNLSVIEYSDYEKRLYRIIENILTTYKDENLKVKNLLANIIKYGDVVLLNLFIEYKKDAIKFDNENKDALFKIRKYLKRSKNPDEYVRRIYTILPLLAKNYGNIFNNLKMIKNGIEYTPATYIQEYM